MALRMLAASCQQCSVFSSSSRVTGKFSFCRSERPIERCNQLKFCNTAELSKVGRDQGDLCSLYVIIQQ